MNSQCEHEFKVDPVDGQVRCIKCRDLDDEMQLFNKGEELKEVKEDLEGSQINFE